MIAFDPDEIIVKDTGSKLVHNPKVDGDYLIEGKWEMTVPEQGGIAYIRITPQLRDFFKLCQEKYGVIGFEYDFEDPGLNFGVVLKKESEK